MQSNGIAVANGGRHRALIRISVLYQQMQSPWHYSTVSFMDLHGASKTFLSKNNVAESKR